MFAETLLESGPHRATRARWTTLASFTLQAMLLSVVLIVPLMYPDALAIIAPKNISIPIFSSMPQPPPPQDNANNRVASRPTAAVHYVAPGDPKLPFGKPRVNGDEWQTFPPAPGPMGSTPALTDIGVATPVVRSAVPLKPITLSHPDPASLIYRVQPVYPHIALITHTQGTVILRAIISKEGNVESLQLVSGSPMLSAAALDAVRQWRYRPYLLNGEAVPVDTQITVNFRLGDY